MAIAIRSTSLSRKRKLKILICFMECRVFNQAYNFILIYLCLGTISATKNAKGNKSNKSKSEYEGKIFTPIWNRITAENQLSVITINFLYNLSFEVERYFLGNVMNCN